ncbi:hypothetical protein GCM10027610_003440 [Dactylosporangium cerinum]
MDPVVIVGAGPVGAASAILLAQRGVPCLLLDRYPTPYPLPRAVHVDDEVMRILQELGIAARFAEVSRPGLGLRLLDGRHRVMAEFRRDPGPGPHGWPQANMFDQPDLERLLRDRVAELPLIEFRGGVTVTAVTSTSVTYTSGEGSGRSRRPRSSAATAPTARSGPSSAPPSRTWGSRSGGWSSTASPTATWPRGAASTRSATRTGRRPSCSWGGIGTGGSSACTTASPASTCRRCSRRGSPAPR